MRWSNVAGRATMILITALCTGAMTTLAAQQPSRAVEQARSTSPGLSGPRIAAEWSRFEPTVAESNTTNSAALAAGGRNHTFVFSTLALVLIGVLVLVLVLD